MDAAVLDPPRRGRPPKFPVPAPQPAVVFDTTGVRPLVTRVTGVDIERYAAWIMPMLQEDFAAPSSVVLHWMRMWSISNEYCFVGTGDAIGLAIMFNEPLNPTPIVQEIFLYAHAHAKHEGIEIYKHFHQWAKTARATRFRFHSSGGAPMAELKSVFPDLQSEKFWYVDID